MSLSTLSIGTPVVISNIFGQPIDVQPIEMTNERYIVAGTVRFSTRTGARSTLQRQASYMQYKPISIKASKPRPMSHVAYRIAEFDTALLESVTEDQNMSVTICNSKAKDIGHLHARMLTELKRRNLPMDTDVKNFSVTRGHLSFTATVTRTETFSEYADSVFREPLRQKMKEAAYQKYAKKQLQNAQKQRAVTPPSTALAA